MPGDLAVLLSSLACSLALGVYLLSRIVTRD